MESEQKGGKLGYMLINGDFGFELKPLYTIIKGD